MRYYQNSEAFSRVQSIHIACGSGPSRSAQRHQGTRGATPQAGRAESESSRTEAETEGSQAFRFGPRRKRPALIHPHFGLARHFRPRQALSNDLTDSQVKAFAIGQRFPVAVLTIVEAKSLFVQISEQVEWFHADVGSVQTALEQAPEVLHRVRMNVAANVLDGMVNHLMGVIGFQSVV